MDDSDVVEAMNLAKALGVQIRIRGTDDDPKLIINDKLTFKLVGTIELRARMKRLKRRENL